MAIDISQFYPVFFEETKEHLAEMEQLLLKLSVDNPDYNQMNAIFRAAHSIKGGSATFGFDDMASVTHVLEGLLDKLRKKEMVLQTVMVDIFLQAADVLKEQLNCHINGAKADPALATAISLELVAFTQQIPAPAIAIKAEEDFGFFDNEAVPEEADDGFGLFEPIQPSAATVTESKVTESKVTAPKVTVSKAIKPTKKLKAKNTPAPLTAIQPAAPIIVERRVADRMDAESTTIRVDVDKVDKLVNLVGELVITEAMLTQSLINAPPALLQALSSSLAQLERNTRDLQEAVMSIRMMPISFVFSRFPRMVRDLTLKLNKEVELVTLGEDTELDKGLIERIADPLTHLIRNSLDHGIELPAARIQSGKPAKGKITLSASHQGGGILIEVSDNGAGLNRQRILSKAIERGLPVSNEMADAEVWDFIFAPGFSTAEAVTDVSGRGVGMDVVKRNISDMGGEVSIDSQAGVGSKISIRLPLTLAILEGMSVALGESLYVIPLNAIVETLKPLPAQIKTVAGGGLMLHTRDEYIPIIVMHKAFGMAGRFSQPEQGMLVVVEAQGKKAALFLDDLVGQQQVVVKSLEANFRRVIGISGATILGDGTVALIIDVPTIIKQGQNMYKAHTQDQAYMSPSGPVLESLGEQHVSN